MVDKGTGNNDWDLVMRQLQEQFIRELLNKAYFDQLSAFVNKQLLPKLWRVLGTKFGQSMTREAVTLVNEIFVTPLT